MPRTASTTTGWVLAAAGVAGVIGGLAPWASLGLASVPGAALAGTIAAPVSAAVLVTGTLIGAGLGRMWLCACCAALGAVTLGAAGYGYGQVSDLGGGLTADWGLWLATAAGAAQLLAAITGLVAGKRRDPSAPRPVLLARRAVAEAPPADDADAPPALPSAPRSEPRLPRGVISEPMVGRALFLFGLVGAVSVMGPWVEVPDFHVVRSGFDQPDGVVALLLMFVVAGAGAPVALLRGGIAAPIVALCCSVGCLAIAFETYASAEKLFLFVAIDVGFVELGWCLVLHTAAAVAAVALSLRALLRRGPAVVVS